MELMLPLIRFWITCMISDQIALHSVQLPLSTPFLLMVFKFGVSHTLDLILSHCWQKSLRLLLKFSDIINLEVPSFVDQWHHKSSPSCFVNYFNPISSNHSCNTHQSQIDNLFVKSVHTTQYSICSLSYSGPKLWNSLSIDVKNIKKFSTFGQYIKSSVIDGYHTIIDS